MTERKAGTTEVVREEVRTGLQQAPALGPLEENVLRLRHGVSVDARTPLARVAPVDSELGDELLVLELQLLRVLRSRALHAAAARGTANPATKSKIVRALRKKR